MICVPFKLLRTSLILVLFFHSLPLCAQTPEPSVSQAPPIHWTRSHDYDVQHYLIKVSFDWTAKSVTGETQITFKPFTNDLKEVEFDAGEMSIAAVKLPSGAPLKFRYVGNQKLYVRLDKAYPAGKDVAVVINYTATPKRGLTFITPNETDKTRPLQIWSQGEAQDNHYWFPCYDFPNDKATSELIATVESKYQVISNGKLVGVQASPAKKTKTYHWLMNQPFSSYLISIIVGEFTEVRDRYRNVPVSSFVYKGQTENARVSFGKLAKMVELFSKKIGYEYPYPKYAQTTVRDFSGAMENITATTMTDTAVHDRRAHLDISSDDVVSHELAHSWFGNLLTCRDWSELWLNEAFASFMETVWTEYDKGKDHALYEIYGDQQGFFQAWNQGYRRPTVTKLYSDPDSLFDAYVYPRGAAVVNMLRFVLGDQMFWKSINHYVKKHQWQNVETQQLVVAIEETTGQNLQWFVDEWLYKMGHPEFEITSAYDDGARQVKLSVKQTQQPDEERKWYPSIDTITMPVDIAITTAAGEKVHRVWIDAREKEFSFAVDSKPLIINFDRGNYLLKQVRFERSDDDLTYQLRHDADTMGRVRAAIELRERRSETAIKGLAEAAQKDKFYAVRLEATRGLDEVQNNITRTAMIAAAKDVHPLVRRAALQGLGAFRDPALADLLISIMKTDQSYYAVAAAALALGQTQSPKAYDALLGVLQMNSWQDTVRVGGLNGLAALQDPRAFDVALKYTAAEHATPVRGAALVLLGETAKNKPGAFEALAEMLKDPSTQVKLSVVTGLMALGDARAIPLLEELAKQPGLPAFAKSFIAGAIKQIQEKTSADK